MKSKNTLIFLDIDGTLLSPDYSVNSDELKNLIEQCQNEGVIFSINSNRSIEDLLPVAEQFGINGPLIGENGVFVYFKKEDYYDYLISEDDRTELAGKLFEVKDECINYFEQEKGKTLIWQNVDTVDFLRSYDNASNQITNDKTIFALNNKFRKYTLSTHLKKFSDSKLKNAITELRDLVRHLKSVKGKYENLNIAFSDFFSNLLVYPKSTSKRKAVKFLIDKYYSDYKVLAIGDEYGDFEMIDGLGDFYTTGNSASKVKDKASYVSQKEYAEGVVDIISKYLV